MYRPGELKVERYGPTIDFDLFDVDEYCSEDSRRRDGDPEPPRVAFLPHSCSEWVIGGPEQMRALIADLDAALREEAAK